MDWKTRSMSFISLVFGRRRFASPYGVTSGLVQARPAPLDHGASVTDFLPVDTDLLVLVFYNVITRGTVLLHVRFWSPSPRAVGTVVQTLRT